MEPLKLISAKKYFSRAPESDSQREGGGGAEGDHRERHQEGHQRFGSTRANL